MGAEFLFVASEHVESAIEPVVVDLLLAHPEKIFERRALEPPLGDPQLTAPGAEARGYQYAGHRRPAHPLPSRLHQLAEQISEAQPVPQGQRQIDLPELPDPFHRHRPHINLLKAGCCFHFALSQLHLPGLRLAAAGQQRVHILPAPVTHLPFIELAQAGHQSLPRSLGRANRLA